LQLRDLQGDIIATAALSESETKLLSTYNSTEFGVPQPGTTPPKYAWLGAAGLATETSFASGASTQSGAAYVPQVARDLQTAPVIPPGAFPNGQGTGEQYGSEIPGWYISLSSQESASTLAEWTAKQEQLKREAEEAGATCESADVCTASVVDPYSVVILDWRDLYKLSLLWYKLARNSAFLSKAFDAIEFATSTVFFGGSIGNYAKWLEKQAHKMWKTAEAAGEEWNHVVFPAMWAVGMKYYEVFGEIVPVAIYPVVKCPFVRWSGKGGTVFNCGTGPIELEGTLW
jgi:hypothetical protein